MKILTFLFYANVLINLIYCLEITEFSIENHANENLAVLKCIVDYGEYKVSEFDQIFVGLNFGGIEFCKLEIEKNRKEYFFTEEFKEFSVDKKKSNRTHFIIKNINSLIYNDFDCWVSVKISSKNKEVRLSDEKKIFSVLGPLSDTFDINSIQFQNNNKKENFDKYEFIYDNQLNQPTKLNELINEINDKKSKNQLKIKHPYFLPYYTRLNLENVFRRINQLEEKQMNETQNIAKLNRLDEKQMNEMKDIKDKLSNINDRIDNLNETKDISNREDELK